MPPTPRKEFPTRIFEMNGRSVEMAYRPDSTDVNVLEEVLVSKPYRYKRLGIQVSEGERWLDLGGNIGSFAAYCYLNGAECESYEPEFTNYSFLRRNVGGLKGIKVNNCALTTSKEETLSFWSGSKDNDHYRFSILPKKRYAKKVELPNRYCLPTFDKEFDGCKMDIEGSELDMIDKFLMPNCKMLIIEYHFSRDRNLERFYQRMNKLRQMYETVYYPPHLDKPNPTGEYQGVFDRLIFCVNRTYGETA